MLQQHYSSAVLIAVVPTAVAAVEVAIAIAVGGREAPTAVIGPSLLILLLLMLVRLS